MKTIFKIIVLLAFLPVLCAGTYFDPLTGQVQTTPPGMANENYADTAAAAAQTAAESHADAITANMATTDTAQDISGLKNFTVQPKFTDGIDESLLATERYIDGLITSLGARFYVTDDEEVIDGYTYRLATQAVCSATVQTVTSPVIDSASVEIARWISPAGDTFPKLISGKYDFIVGLNWEGGTGTEPVLKAFWKLQVLEADGVTIRTLATSDDSLVIGATVETEDMFLILLEDEEIAAGERIIGSVYGKWVSGRQNATIVLSYCGALKSHWELPTNVEVLDTMYEPLGTAAALTTNMAETTEDEEITGDWTHKGKLYVTKHSIITSDDVEVDVAIAAGADDGRYLVSNTSLLNDATQLSFGYNTDRGFFLRFADVNIPQNAKIKESQLRLTSAAGREDQTITIKTGFVDSATVAQPTEYADLAAYVVPPGDVTDHRIGTADRVITTTVLGTTYGFPEVATNATFVAGMQTLVDKETWVMGTADIMLIITCADGDSDNYHRFATHENTTYAAPILRVTYYTETGDIETIDVEADMARTDVANTFSEPQTMPGLTIVNPGGEDVLLTDGIALSPFGLLPNTGGRTSIYSLFDVPIMDNAVIGTDAFGNTLTRVLQRIPTAFSYGSISVIEQDYQYTGTMTSEFPVLPGVHDVLDEFQPLASWIESFDPTWETGHSATRVDDTSFLITGADVTGTYVKGISVQMLNASAEVIGYAGVVSSSESGGDTTVVVLGNDVTVSLDSVKIIVTDSYLSRATVVDDDYRWHWVVRAGDAGTDNALIYLSAAGIAFENNLATRQHLTIGPNTNTPGINIFTAASPINTAQKLQIGFRVQVPGGGTQLSTSVKLAIVNTNRVGEDSSHSDYFSVETASWDGAALVQVTARKENGTAQAFSPDPVINIAADWADVLIQITPNSESVALYIDGTLVSHGLSMGAMNTWTGAVVFFGVTDLVEGATSTAWFDDVSICNHDGCF